MSSLPAKRVLLLLWAFCLPLQAERPLTKAEIVHYLQTLQRIGTVLSAPEPFRHQSYDLSETKKQYFRELLPVLEALHRAAQLSRFRGIQALPLFPFFKEGHFLSTVLWEAFPDLEFVLGDFRTYPGSPFREVKDLISRKEEDPKKLEAFGQILNEVLREPRNSLIFAVAPRILLIEENLDLAVLLSSTEVYLTLSQREAPDRPTLQRLFWHVEFLQRKETSVVLAQNRRSSNSFLYSVALDALKRIQQKKIKRPTAAGDLVQWQYELAGHWQDLQGSVTRDRSCEENLAGEAPSKDLTE